MNWKKALLTIILFYIFAILQNSFFVNFDLSGTAPNLVFAYFFTLVYFLKNNSPYLTSFYAIIAGFLLDVFSSGYFGFSVILLLIIGFLLKITQSSLKNQKDNQPFVYFFPLFIVFLLIYELAISFRVDFSIIFRLIYTAVFAIIFFRIYKK